MADVTDATYCMLTTAGLGWVFYLYPLPPLPCEACIFLVPIS